MVVLQPNHTHRRRQPSPDKRAAILAGARIVFLAQGFAEASMDEVAARAGVSKMTVYRHFGSKEDLFAGVVAASCDALADDGLRVAMEGQPLAEALRIFGRRMLEIVFDPDIVKLHRMVIAESTRFPDLGRLFYERGPEASIAALAEVLARHGHDPRLAGTDSRLAAEEFLEAVRGYPHMRLLLAAGPQPTARQKEARIDRAIDRLLGAGHLSG